jgi:hypothetical protein
MRESMDQGRMIREVAKRHGVPVIDTYYVLKNATAKDLQVHLVFLVFS